MNREQQEHQFAALRRMNRGIILAWYVLEIVAISPIPLAAWQRDTNTCPPLLYLTSLEHYLPRPVACFSTGYEARVSADDSPIAGWLWQLPGKQSQVNEET